LFEAETLYAKLPDGRSVCQIERDRFAVHAAAYRMFHVIPFVLASYTPPPYRKLDSPSPLPSVPPFSRNRVLMLLGLYLCRPCRH